MWSLLASFHNILADLVSNQFANMFVKIKLYEHLDISKLARKNIDIDKICWYLVRGGVFVRLK